MRVGSGTASNKLLIAAAGRRIRVVIRRNSRARRIILRVDEALGLPILTLPSRTSLDRGAAFFREHVAWVEEQLRRLAPSAPFADGSVFPLRGVPCRIRLKRGRGVVELERRGESTVLLVPGEPEFLARRVTDWLKREARRDFEKAVARYSALVGKSPKAIRVGDPKSRWGSCSSKGVRHVLLAAGARPAAGAAISGRPRGRAPSGNEPRAAVLGDRRIVSTRTSRWRGHGSASPAWGSRRSAGRAEQPSQPPDRPERFRLSGTHDRNPLLSWSMILSEKRYPLFGIVLSPQKPAEEAAAVLLLRLLRRRLAVRVVAQNPGAAPRFVCRLLVGTDRRAEAAPAGGPRLRRRLQPSERR